MIPIPRDFRDFIALLNARRVRYLIIGGYAVAYHGYPRTTGDLDVFVELSQANARALLAVFTEFGFSADRLSPEFFMDRGEVVRLGREPMRLEILNDISGVFFSECYRRRVRARMEGLTINFIDLPELIANKRASGRAKDLADLENLPSVPTRRRRRALR
jgi:predicted nucleotidyltransferase